MFRVAPKSVAGNGDFSDSTEPVAIASRHLLKLNSKHTVCCFKTISRTYEYFFDTLVN